MNLLHKRKVVLSVAFGMLAIGLPVPIVSAQTPAPPPPTVGSQLPAALELARQRDAVSLRLQALEQSFTENLLENDRFRFLSLPLAGAGGALEGLTLAPTSEPAPVMILSGAVTSGADTRFPVTLSVNPFRALGVSDQANPSLAQSAVKIVFAPVVIKPKTAGTSQVIAAAKTGNLEYSIKFSKASTFQKGVAQLREYITQLDGCLQSECSLAVLTQLIVEGNALFAQVQDQALSRQTTFTFSSAYGWDTGAGSDTIVLGTAVSRNNFGQVVNGQVRNPVTLALGVSWTMFREIEQGRVSIVPSLDRQLRDGLALRLETRFDHYRGDEFVRIPGRSDSRTEDWALTQSLNFTVLNDKAKKLSIVFKQLHVLSKDLEFSVGLGFSMQLGAQQ